ncbi:zinc ABC transporter substrate-binding protein [Mycobacterium sherrisii]|uniref:ABC transporter substrate-binding protein n=1 Tax=Mycobacterium sherrisii TaxID=243061 RepID=A0A1E3T7S6_9MYCO|nr:zinc ABC transporter substrate-binding protein [Mycobacterium sherrisii]MEC4763155.1 zinc ABC transporter substrate-binding protein [Mycobacterium sherrisii]ODR10430.1 ABC transporter substrate-binding protein [Mycobacterium sherrisii]
MAGRRRSAAWVAVNTVAVLFGVIACGGGNPAQSGPTGTSGPGAASKLAVVATINAWGSIAAQLGGDRVQETSIITNPNTDPHSYEPSAADARAVSDATVVIENGIGYDAWADKMLASESNSKHTVVNVGDTVGVPAGGNPHQWYSPDSVTKVAGAITAAYKKADPADSAYFDQRNTEFLNQTLATYHGLIATIKAKYAGTPVGASESIFAPLSDALGLNLITPPEFLKAISEGTDPSPADKATIDHQIATKAVRVYVFNTQNATPDVQAQVDAAKNQGIPVTTVTETLSPENASFQDWQSSQLSALSDALHGATGK